MERADQRRSADTPVSKRPALVRAFCLGRVNLTGVGVEYSDRHRANAEVSALADRDLLDWPNIMLWPKLLGRHD